MGTFTFTYSPDPGVDSPEIAVRISSDSDYLPDVIVAFEQFLLGVTFQPVSITKYVDIEKVHTDQDKMRA